MNGDSQRKGYSRWNYGPETEPQLKQMYHGLGGSPVFHYTGNPVSWLVTLQHCIPFLKLNTGEADQPLDQAVSDDLLSAVYADQGPFDSTGSIFTSDPGGYAYEHPQGGSSPLVQPGTPQIVGTTNGTAIGTIRGKNVPLWGSRKTYIGG